jgi:hypothetical protein
MRRLGAWILLGAMSMGCCDAAMALPKNTLRGQSKADRKADKKQQKAQKKYAKAQKKAQKKMMKKDRKNTRMYPARH